ncbi:2-oxoglutarate dehydrogenase E1 component [Vitreoscilla stercoraria]|uniref:oxoglutarate dehydrogenase (succinyl-transferring) n=1 Tax=Vitreoscilla stercoraria TaxID=61 RepID=A0ABY4EAD3_VITST|nr:2-oxoglutarate dehydrogenase E1 component [Vitreoscilla stercoraria]UOO92716.1 2-oxoglutarate dehydrogenase E1 component [Vitreoscilla stercoraria]
MMNEEFGLSYLYGSNAPYIEELYEMYLKDPSSVDSHWKQYFDEIVTLPGAAARDVAHAPIQQSFVEMAKRPVTQHAASASLDANAMKKQVAVLRLISAYRVLGSRHANIDPLQRMSSQYYSELDPASYGLTAEDMAVQFNASSNFSSSDRLPLSEIINKLQQTYCGTVGVEYMHITRSEEKHWVQDRFENDLSTPRFNTETKKRILGKITAAETLERYLHTKYVGQKRFSLEGGEAAIPALDYLIQNSTKEGVEEVIIGMAHRGRLNVLVNILGKSPKDLFSEFEGKYTVQLPSGDVKYHNGFSSDIPTANGPMHISLAFNPSHLEIVNPVVEGSVRARQRRRGEDGQKQVMPVLIHGDSAFIGLGVNQGTFNLSQTRGYTTGGTVHIVINNQIGFTTSDTRDTRSTVYCTDIAKMVDAPIFHVNGDDPEAVCYVMQAAIDYRMKFKKDVVVDLVCYRKLGHNEGDDPYLTQPMMYKKIAQHPGSRAIYAEKLAKEGVVSAEDSDNLIKTYRAALDKGEHVEQTKLTDYQRKHALDWSQYMGTHWAHPVDTALPAADIQRLSEKLIQVPADFQLHNTVKKLLESRKKMGVGEMPIDWGMAENLAYASLVTNGNGVRISGEDSGRGTFSHRHAVFHDQSREKWDAGAYIPLRNMSENQANFMVIDSILNEEAVLAYEYGFACSAPEQLVIWEAQFGDFANGAQVAIDQFIASGETKWGRLCGLTVLMPHGYDGQGPEHSSARLERWLQLCSEHNMQIVMMSEASQMFHVLRRQVLRPYRKPLIIFMSKRLLRFKDSMSDLSQFTEGSGFRTVIGDAHERDDANVKRVVLCAGQVYYDLVAGRKERGSEEEIAIVRVEQLYPFPYEVLAAELSRYTNATEIMWAQEEPKNQGAWYQIRHRIESVSTDKQKVTFAGRPTSASPAVGYMSKHAAQLKALVETACNLDA